MKVYVAFIRTNGLMGFHHDAMLGVFSTLDLASESCHTSLAWEQPYEAVWLTRSSGTWDHIIYEVEVDEQ